MEREYNVGTWLTPSDEYIKDIKDALVEKGVATELTPNEELSEVVKNSSFLKFLLDVTKRTSGLFQYFEGSNVDNLIAYNDTENVINMSNTFDYCQNLTSIPLLNTSNVTNMDLMFRGCSSLPTIPLLDTSNVTNMGSMFIQCSKLTSIPPLDTSEVTMMNQMFYWCRELPTIPLLDTSKVKIMDSMFNDCRNLTSIPLLDMSKVTSASNMFSGCSKLTTLTLKNIKINLTIGSGTSYGHLLTLGSLINTCKECIKQSKSRTLTVGTANLTKLADVYVRFVDTNQTEIAVGEKGEVEVCEADNNSAMTITEYMALKSWTLA